MANIPNPRRKNITGYGKGVKKRGSGLGTGPVGSSDGYSGRPGTSGHQPSFGNQQSGGSSRSTRGGGGGLFKIILIVAALFLGGGFGLNGILGGFSNSNSSPTNNQLDGNTLFSMLSSSTTSTGWDRTANLGRLDTSVVSGAREKRTTILGNGKDTVTIMVYMCGTDLESKSGMASSDLAEMAKATIGKKVNLLVYTGGCKSWQTSGISNTNNQIYQIQNGKLTRLVSNAGSASMTDPNTLSSYISFCKQNFPANRYDLILWDHGGGSLTGYGYDEKNRSSGSMGLADIQKALSAANVTFDFIGFDACLMATLENALMLSPYADYLIASEETEPGIGWYYTNWLTALSKNTSMPTLEIGKIIVDDFVSTCNSQCRGQATTLSVIDLAELEYTVPSKLNAFAQDTAALLKSNDYKTVSDARSTSREFAASSRIDQVDLVHLATRLGTNEGEALAQALLGAVKYNQTSSSMMNAYGLSIYFPYQQVSNVNSAVSTYKNIGIDSDYTRCIQQFASMEIGGQAVSGGAASPFTTLQSGIPSSGNASGMLGQQEVLSLLGNLLGGNPSNVSGLTNSNFGFLSSFLDANRDSEYLTLNQFDASKLVWQDANGTPTMYLTDEQWELVQKLELNVFFDDGEGFIDLGLDNYFEFSDDSGLIGTYDGTWLAIDEQPVAYYHVNTVQNGDSYITTGRVPVMLNGSRADLILVFDNDHPDGYIAGARSDYKDGETETIAKGMTGLKDGDKLEFLCDYYDYNGTYQDSYYLGDPMTYHADMAISYVYIDKSAASPVYRFTDIYNQQYWSELMES